MAPLTSKQTPAKHELGNVGMGVDLGGGDYECNSEEGGQGLD